MMFNVSVIIPVYNAAEFVRQAVESAVHLEEVSEVILVEDKSPDNALEVCRLLALEYPKVTLLTHPNGENRGAGLSRNLGVENAKSEFVAFLDADDFYLSNRFHAEKLIFEKDETVDGVYNASAYLIDSEYAREVVSKRFKTPDPVNYVRTVRERINPEELFYHLVRGGKGHFNTNTVTVRKSLFQLSGGFNNLILHEDTHLFVRLALQGKLVAGNIDTPTAKVRVHKSNRIKNTNRTTLTTYYYKLYQELRSKITTKREYSILVKKAVSARSRISKNKVVVAFARIWFMLVHFLIHPLDLFKVSPKYLMS